MNNYMLNDYYAIRDNASGYFLDGKRLEKNGEIQLYSKPGPAKGIITKMKKSDYYRSGKAGFVADNLEVVPIMLVPKY